MANQEFIKNLLLKVWFKDDDSLNILIWQTLEVFNEWLETEILMALSDENMEKFDSLVQDDPSDEKIYNFFFKSIPDFDEFMDGLYEKFEKKYISEYNKSLNK